MKTLFLTIATLLGTLWQCEGDKSDDQSNFNNFLVDKSADRATLESYLKIRRLTERGTMLGHHETTAYGIGWAYDGTTTNSDVQKTGGDFPAIYGWDFSGIDMGRDQVIDGVQVTNVAKLVRIADMNGGINTFCWHAYNPINGTDSWTVDNTTVQEILPSGKNYAKFRTSLERIATFAKSLKRPNGESIPILFRPWHEHTGDWFWWGTSSCTPAQFKELWQTTVKVLRDTLGVHNFIYVYSSGDVKSRNNYLERYPGDEYVDILGFDDYGNDASYVARMNESIRIIKELGKERNKPYAITETGNEKIERSDWFTTNLYPMIKDKGLAYVMLWRNANPEHHYVPYPGHNAVVDFKNFCQKSDVLLLGDVKK